MSERLYPVFRPRVSGPDGTQHIIRSHRLVFRVIPEKQGELGLCGRKGPLVIESDRTADGSKPCSFSELRNFPGESPSEAYAGNSAADNMETAKNAVKILLNKTLNIVITLQTTKITKYCYICPNENTFNIFLHQLCQKKDLQ